VTEVIENPADLTVLRLALQDAIARSRNERFITDARIVLAKVEKLEAAWIHRRATRPPRKRRRTHGPVSE
jgi:hypothetical protein